MAAESPLKGQDYLVIGGGMVGASAALRLRLAGARVTLVDPGDLEARASFGNAGQMCTDHVEPAASFANVLSAPSRLFAFGGPLDFRAEDIGAWLPWTAEYLLACLPARFRRGTEATAALQAHAVPAWKRLLRDAGAPELFEEKGYFSLWESEAAAAAGLKAALQANLGPATARAPTPEELSRLRAAYGGRPKGGVWYEGAAGKLRDPGATNLALLSALEAEGGSVVKGRVARLEFPGGRPTGRLDDGRVMIGADRVLVAGGVRSAALMRDAGMRAPLISERGYHLRFPEHHCTQDMAPALFQDRWVFINRFDSGLRLSGFTELGRPDTAPDPRKWATLRRHARELDLPVEGEGIEWCGSRPTLPDFLPAIGRVAGRPGVLYAFGHNHVGVTLAAATAEALVEMAESGGVPDRLAAFSLSRFNTGS